MACTLAPLPVFEVNLHYKNPNPFQEINEKYKAMIVESVNEIYSKLRPQDFEKISNIEQSDIIPHRVLKEICEVAKLFPMAPINKTKIKDTMPVLSSAFKIGCDIDNIKYTEEEFDILEYNFYKAYSINIIYELNVMCTSSCIRINENSIYHIRNLDLSIYENLSKMSYHAKFLNYDPSTHHENPQVWFEAIMFAGISGIFTAVKPDVYSISINSFKSERTNDLDTQNYGSASSFLIRQILLEQNTYEEAVKSVEDSNLLTPAYFTICGTKGYEGQIIYKPGRNKEKLELNPNSSERDGLTLDAWKNNDQSGAFKISKGNLFKQTQDELSLQKPTIYESTIGSMRKPLRRSKNVLNLTLLNAQDPSILNSFNQARALRHPESTEYYNCFERTADYTNQCSTSLNPEKAYIVVGNRHGVRADNYKKINNAKRAIESILGLESIQPFDLFNVLLTKEVFNKNYVYGAVMSAAGNIKNQDIQPLIDAYGPINNPSSYIVGAVSYKDTFEEEKKTGHVII